MVGHGPGPCGRYSQPVSSSPSTERSRRSSGLVSSSAFTLGVLAPRELARVWLPVLLSGVAAQLASSIDQTPRGSYQLSAVSALSLIHISEPTRLGMISYAVFCLQ